MAQPVILPSFGAGELAPSMYGRVDLAKYHVGAARLRNYFVDYRGGASSRTGTQFVGQAKDSTTPNRLIPFQFNTQQTYALVFGNQSLRFVTNGAYVLEAPTAITGISNSSLASITDVGHGYSNGDLVYLSGIVGTTQLNQRFGIVTGATANSFSLNDMFGNPISTSSYGAYVSGGTAARVYTLSTPYAGSDLALLKFTQSADTMTLVHPGYAPYTLKRIGNANWQLAAVTFQPSSTPPTGVTVTFQNRGTGTAYPNTQYGYAVTAIVKGVESLPSAVVNSTSLALGQNVGAQNAIGWASVTGATLYNVYRTQENLGSNVPQGALLGYIGSASPATTNSFIDDNILPDFTRCPPQAYNPFTTAGNPGCVTYYQQRQAFGGMANAPEQIDFSKSGDFFNMDYSIPSKDNDNIEITIASQQVNAIKHLVPMQSLIALTSSGAWKIDAGTGAAITPTQIQATPQAYNGCSDVPPLIINYDILYVQSKGSIVRDLSYNFYVNVFTGTDISLLANHLFYGHQITEWCYAEEPFKLIWCVREDGILLSLAYLKEQDVYAWSHHDTDGLFKSICSISEGQENAVYVIVERLINGQYLQYIERFASRQMKSDPTIGLPADASLAWCVDAGLQYQLTKPNATLTPTETTNVPVVYGVHVISGGQNYSPGTVITVTDSTGVGAVLTPVIVGGVIQSVTVSQQGSNYTNPTLSIIDPAGTGAGATLQAILASPVPMNASAGVFGSANVGDVVRINGGMGTVLQVVNSQQIIVNVTIPLTSTWPAVANAWSITTPVSSIRGLDHLNGQTVSILADGNVAPPQIVVDGAITLDRAYSAITAGLPFTCQLQSLYLDVQSADGTIQSKRKTVPAVTVRMQDTRGLKAGPTFDNLVEIKERTTEPMGQTIKLFTGDQRIVLPASYNVPGQICIQQDYPLPSTILALIPEVVVGDTR